MLSGPKISPCLWFDNEAEEAARFYTGIFKNSKINKITRYSAAGYETHKRAVGSVMTVSFELNGQPFTALNGGPVFTFNEAISLEIPCKDQEEIDYYWEKLSAGGDPNAQVCGWLKDRYGVSWQVFPKDILDLYEDEHSPGAQAAFEAMLKMKKIDWAEIKRAYDEASATASRGA